MYLKLYTQPDIIFAVNNTSRKSTNTTYEDWFYFFKIFKYLKGNRSYGTKFNKNNSIKAFVDSNNGGETTTRRSTTGIIILIGTGPVGFHSKFQYTESSENEYYALDVGSNHCVWYENLFK